MKTLKLGLPALILALGLVFGQTGFAFAHEHNGGNDREARFEEHIKSLKDASAALATTNPDLSAKLNQIVADKEKMKEEMKTKMEEMKARHEENAKTLKEASVALEKINPELSAKLGKAADRKAGWKDKENHGGCCDKNEGPAETK